MDEWSINRDRALAEARGDTENAILDSMRKHGLRKVKYGERPSLEDFNEEQLQKLKESEELSTLKEGHIKPEDPDLLRSLLKWYLGEVGEKKRLWTDFFEQWTRDELLFLKYTIIWEEPTMRKFFVEKDFNKDMESLGLNEEERKRNYSITLYNEGEWKEHPFVLHKREWNDLIKSNPYSVKCLDSVIKNGVSEDINREGWWLALIEEYKRRLIVNPTKHIDDSDSDEEEEEEEKGEEDKKENKKEEEEEKEKEEEENKIEKDKEMNSEPTNI